MGRPCKLTEKRKNAIVKSIKTGNYIETSCAAAGIDESTYYNYLVIGKKDKSEGKKSIYSDFFDAIKRAEAEAEETLVTTIKAASFDEWQAAAFLLERKNPKRWGRKEAIDHTINEKVNTEEVQKTVASIISDAKLLEASEEILDRFAKAEPEPSKD